MLGAIIGDIVGSPYEFESDKTKEFTMLETSVDNYGVTMCHYPLLTWRHKLKTYMIHGHIHNDTSSDFWPLIRDRERVLNAGVDINGFEPVTLEELIENNRLFKDNH